MQPYRATGPTSRVPGDLCTCTDVALLVWFVNRGLPTFILNRSLHFKVIVNALGSRNLKVILGGAARNEVLGSLCIPVGKLYPLSRREVIREPRLAAF